FGYGAAKSTFSATGVLTFPAGYTPGAPLEAATKGYVDGQVTGGGGWAKNGSVVSLAAPGDNVVMQTTATVYGNAFSVGGSTAVVSAGRGGIGSPSTGPTLFVRDPSSGQTNVTIQENGNPSISNMLN